MYTVILLCITKKVILVIKNIIGGSPEGLSWYCFGIVPSMS